MLAISVMSLFGTISRLYVPSRVAETLTRYWLPEPVRAVTGLSAPPWSIVSVQLSRVPVSPPALSLTRKIQSPAIPVPSKSGVVCLVYVVCGTAGAAVQRLGRAVGGGEIHHEIADVRVRDVHGDGD